MSPHTEAVDHAWHSICFSFTTCVKVHPLICPRAQMLGFGGMCNFRLTPCLHPCKHWWLHKMPWKISPLSHIYEAGSLGQIKVPRYSHGRPKLRSQCQRLELACSRENNVRPADTMPSCTVFSFPSGRYGMACDFLGIIRLPLPTRVYSCESVCIYVHALHVHRTASYRNYSVVCFLAPRGEDCTKIQPCCSKETLRIDVKYISLEAWLCDGL